MRRPAPPDSAGRRPEQFFDEKQHGEDSRAARQKQVPRRDPALARAHALRRRNVHKRLLSFWRP